MRVGRIVLGFLAGGGLGWGLSEARYINWHDVIPPVGARPLVLRHDGKGDGRFGAPRSGDRRHQGIDVAAELGSPIRAIRSGVIVQVGNHRGLGQFLEIEHRGDVTSRYAHLETVAVTVGRRVTQGEIIGTVGKTGNALHPSIVPHVHLEVRRSGAPIDPTSLGLQVVAAPHEDDEAEGSGGL